MAMLNNQRVYYINMAFRTQDSPMDWSNRISSLYTVYNYTRIIWIGFKERRQEPPFFCGQQPMGLWISRSKEWCSIFFQDSSKWHVPTLSKECSASAEWPVPLQHHRQMIGLVSPIAAAWCSHLLVGLPTLLPRALHPVACPDVKRCHEYAHK